MIFKKIRKVFVSATMLALIEKIFEMVINFLFSMFVVRALDIKDYAVITTFTGYMTFVGFVNMAPETYLYKSYSTLNRELLNKNISSFLVFNAIKAIIILFVYLIIGSVLSQRLSNYYYLFIGITNGLILFFEQFYCVARIILEINYKQYKLTRLTLITKFLRVLLTLSLFINNSFVLYCIIVLVIAFIEDSIVFWVSIKEINFRFTFEKFIFLENIKNALSEFVFFNHICGVLNSIIYSSDTVFLGWHVKEEVVGHYGIVLTCVNYVTAICQVVQKQVSIALGRSSVYKENQKTVYKFMKLSVSMSVCAVVAYICIGNPLLKIYAGDSYVVEMFWYALFILIGASIFNAVRPMLIYIMYRGNLAEYLKRILIPIFLFSMVVYYFTSKCYGAIGLSFGNIITYGIWSIFSVIYYFTLVKRHSMIEVL